jgi:integrase
VSFIRWTTTLSIAGSKRQANECGLATLHLRVHGKGGKVRYLPLHPGTAELVADYLEIAGHAGEPGGALFRPVKNNTSGTVERAVTADGVYKMVKHYAKRVGVNIEGFGAHSLRATAATNALDHQADIAKVQEWLGHANIATTRLYDPEEDQARGQPDV